MNGDVFASNVWFSCLDEDGFGFQGLFAWHPLWNSKKNQTPDAKIAAQVSGGKRPNGDTTTLNVTIIQLLLVNHLYNVDLRGWEVCYSEQPGTSQTTPPLI